MLLLMLMGDERVENVNTSVWGLAVCRASEAWVVEQHLEASEVLDFMANLSLSAVFISAET